MRVLEVLKPDSSQDVFLPSSHTLLPALLLALVLASGCSVTEGSGGSDEGVDHLALEDALTYSSDTPVTVAGYFLVEAGAPRLCASLAESDPPQCGGAKLDVVSLPGRIPPMHESADGRVRWVGERVVVMGVVSGGEIAVGHFVGGRSPP